MSRSRIANREHKIAIAKQRIGLAQNRLHQLEARHATDLRKLRSRKLILIGVTVWNKAEKDARFRASLMAWLNKGLQAERDRALFDLGPSQAQPDKPGKPTMEAGKG